MSQQYQKFKQNFLKQHPNSNFQMQGHANTYSTQNNQMTYKTYDPYRQLTNPSNNYTRKLSDQNLKIQNQSHFPFQQLENQTFSDPSDDPFFAYKQSQKNNQNYQQNINQQNNMNGQRNNNNLFFSKEQDSDLNLNQYIVNSQHPSKYASSKYQAKQKSNLMQTTKKQASNNSRVQYKNYWQNDSELQNHRSRQQSQLQRINKQLERVKQYNSHNNSKILNNSNFANQDYTIKHTNRFVQNSNQNVLRPQTYSNQSVNQYVVQNRKNNPSPLSPSKQLPIIYNTPNNLTNSGHKLSNQTYSPNNSRVIIQGNPPTLNQIPGPIITNQLNPRIIQSPPPSISPPLVQKVNSNSRLIIQSQTINGSKGINSGQFIPSTSNIIVSPPPPQQIQSQRHIVQVHQGGYISIKDFQNVKNQCIMWQQRYNQVNQQLARMQTTQFMGNQNGNMIHQQQNIQLREQNYRLMQKIRSLQNNQRLSYDRIKSSSEQLLKKYQDSLMKQCSLLVDRFRLQLKHNQRY